MAKSSLKRSDVLTLALEVGGCDIYLGMIEICTALRIFWVPVCAQENVDDDVAGVVNCLGVFPRCHACFTMLACGVFSISSQR